MDLFTSTLPLAAVERIRKLEALAERPGTPGEGVAARAALQRIKARYEVVFRPTVTRAKACKCGSTRFAVGPGKGPHAHHYLRRVNCGRGGIWMSRAVAKQFEVAS